MLLGGCYWYIIETISGKIILVVQLFTWRFAIGGGVIIDGLIWWVRTGIATVRAEMSHILPRLWQAV